MPLGMGLATTSRLMASGTGICLGLSFVKLNGYYTVTGFLGYYSSPSLIPSPASYVPVVPSIIETPPCD